MLLRMGYWRDPVAWHTEAGMRRWISSETLSLGIGTVRAFHDLHQSGQELGIVREAVNVGLSLLSLLVVIRLDAFECFNQIVHIL